MGTSMGRQRDNGSQRQHASEAHHGNGRLADASQLLVSLPRFLPGVKLFFLTLLSMPRFHRPRFYSLPVALSCCNREYTAGVPAHECTANINTPPIVSRGSPTIPSYLDERARLINGQQIFVTLVL